jgi:lipoyl(octanoyl) transferase
MNSPRRSFVVRELGIIEYSEALELQDHLVRERREGTISDTILLLEHPHVITLGSSSDHAHVLLNKSELAERGIKLFEVGRGGDVTYHGPGQLVVYPIMDLKPDRKDLHQYLRDLESVLIQVACSFGIRANRDPSGTGVFTELGKLGAIGVRVSSGWITSHGIALNVSTKLDFFETIVPCGIRDRGVSSLEQELQAPVCMAEVKKCMVESFNQVFSL